MLLADLFLFRDTPYCYARDNSRSPLLMPFLLLGTGIIYGFLVSLFQKTAGVELHGVAVDQISNQVLFGGNIISGILVVLTFHGGMTLLVWLMAKAVAGPGNLAVLYRTTAYLLPQVLLGLPFLASRSALPGGGFDVLPYSWIYLPLAAYAFISITVGLFHIFRVSQQVTDLRCAFAVFLLLFFSFAVLVM
jgi:hypothetical protein